VFVVPVVIDLITTVAVTSCSPKKETTSPSPTERVTSFVTMVKM
jgi:hypothetical protein